MVFLADLAFPLLSPPHLAVIFATLAVPALLAAWVRAKKSPPLERNICLVLAAVLVANVAVSICLGAYIHGGFGLRHSLPMHLCDWAMFATAIALVVRRQQAFELAYLWGLSGTFQAIVTPNLTTEDPLIRVITFFIAHCGIVAGALFMTWGLRFRTTKGAVWRALFWSQLYLISAGLVDWLTGANYGFLRQKPFGRSLLDFLGPWPWYILCLEAAALVFYAIFNLPFSLTEKSREKPVKASDPASQAVLPPS